MVAADGFAGRPKPVRPPDAGFAGSGDNLKSVGRVL